MATVIKRPQVGELRRRVVQHVKSSQVTSQQSGLSNESAVGVPKSSAAETEENTHNDESGDGNSILEQNPLAEPLKLANKRAEVAEEKIKIIEEELEKRKTAAKEQGYEDGYVKGQEQGLIDFNERMSVIDELAIQMNQRIDHLLIDAEDVVVEVAYAAVGKILSGLLIQKDAVVSIVKSQLERLSCEARQLVVHVSHKDFTLLNESHDAESALPAELRLVADDRINYGGCIIESNSGNLDARLEVQLQELLELFLKIRRQGIESGD